jgi:hypothetical protein
MIDKHQLIKSSMNMLAEGVGACSGARGIPYTISTKRIKEESSVTSSSKSVRSPCTAATGTESDVGDTLAKSIMEHAAMVRGFRDHAAMKEKWRHNDAI